MTIEPIPQQRSFGELGFDAFYRTNLGIVYGYALRLCGGSVERAQDLNGLGRRLGEVRPRVHDQLASEVLDQTSGDDRVRWRQIGRSPAG